MVNVINAMIGIDWLTDNVSQIIRLDYSRISKYNL